MVLDPNSPVHPNYDPQAAQRQREDEGRIRQQENALIQKLVMEQREADAFKRAQAALTTPSIDSNRVSRDSSEFRGPASSAFGSVAPIPCDRKNE